MRRSRMAIVGTAVAVLTTGGMLGGPVGFAAADQASTGSKASDDGLARFHQQPITWHSCQLDAKDDLGQQLDQAKAQCAEILVPMDYSHPDGRTMKIAISRLKATDPLRRRGTLFNPGALTFSGRQQTLMLKQTEAAVAARYDLVGMDLRFEGRSGRIDCQWPTGEFLRSAGPNRKTFNESVAFAKDLASRCAGQKDLLPHASTLNAARDMNTIRAALGESQLSYLGYSYATHLGATYLQLFPDRADRIVLDSALGPDVWGPGYQRTTSPGQTAQGKDWAAWAARRNHRYHLGATTTQVLATVNRINQAAARRPLKVGRYRVDVHQLAVILNANSYQDSAAGVQVLRDAVRGRPVTPTPFQEWYLALIANPDVNGDTSTTMAKVCADGTASPDPQTYYRDIQAHRAAEPLFGPMLRNISLCAFWPTPPAEPRPQIHNDVPTLIVGASDDPATPLAGQQAMHQALTGSRLITVRGALRHVVYGPLASVRNPCVETAVNRYLLNGTLPTTDTTCAETGKS